MARVTTTGIFIDGDKQLIKRLSKLDDKPLVKILNSSARESMKPMATKVQTHTPEKTGALFQSIGIIRKTDKKTGQITVRIAVRERFTFKRHGRDDTTVRHGFRKEDRGHPRTYVRAIEEGINRKGTRRKAGPARMFQRGFDEHQASVQSNVRTTIIKKLERTVAR